MNTRFKTLFLTLFLGIQLVAFSQCEVLVWNDEFDGSGLPNSANWTFDIGTGSNGWGNSEIQSYTNSTTNVRQSNGVLTIEAIKSGNSWTSARIKTQTKKTFKYGKIVFRAKLPTGVGTWPALWMLGENITSVGWPACGEIDVMEHVGRNQNVIQAALHTPSSFGNTQNKGSVVKNTVSSQFHEYSVSWNADRIVFSLDNVPYYTYNPSVKNSSTWPFDAPQFLIMNIAIGGTFGGSVDPALTNAKMEIDYVRVYEERDSPVIEGPQFVFENQQDITYSAPDYGDGVSYTWTVPSDATIVSGQGTNQIKVRWGATDGTVSLSIAGETGCSSNTASANVATIVELTGRKYELENFSNVALTGWTKNDAGISMQNINNTLKVTYNVNALKYIQYSFPKAIDLSNHGIVKLPIRVPNGTTLPNLLFTLTDGDGNETITTNFEVKVNKNNGEFYTYTYDFSDRWALNSPKVNEKFIKSLRIYMLSGQASFDLDNIILYNSEIIPEAPSGLTAGINENGEITLSWNNGTNASAFNLYRSGNINENFVKIRSNILTSDVPYSINPTASINFYKVSGVNNAGESALSEQVEVIATITDAESDLDTSITIYPNPCNGRCFINTNGLPVSELKILDMRGAAQSFNKQEDGSLLIIDFKASASGVYYLLLKQTNKIYVKRIIVE